MRQAPDVYFVGSWLVEPSLLRISRNEQTKKIEPQVMAVLECQVSKSGQVMSKEELRTTVWADVIVTENVLTRAISSLRKALEDDRYNPEYIETISKAGYRLIAPVRHEIDPKTKNRFITTPVKGLMLAGIGLPSVAGIEHGHHRAGLKTFGIGNLSSGGPWLTIRTRNTGRPFHRMANS